MCTPAARRALIWMLSIISVTALITCPDQQRTHSIGDLYRACWIVAPVPAFIWYQFGWEGLKKVLQAFTMSALIPYLLLLLLGGLV